MAVVVASTGLAGWVNLAPALEDLMAWVAAREAQETASAAAATSEVARLGQTAMRDSEQEVQEAAQLAAWGGVAFLAAMLRKQAAGLEAARPQPATKTAAKAAASRLPVAPVARLSAAQGAATPRLEVQATVRRGVAAVVAATAWDASCSCHRCQCTGDAARLQS